MLRSGWKADCRAVDQRGGATIDVPAPVAGWVDAIADLDNVPPQVGDGYRIEARIVIWQSPNTLKVPVSALFREGQGWAVFVVGNGRAHKRSVRVGHRNESEAEILAGLCEEDRVIVHPADDIEEGKRVTDLKSTGG